MFLIFEKADLEISGFFFDKEIIVLNKVSLKLK